MQHCREGGQRGEVGAGRRKRVTSAASLPFLSVPRQGKAVGRADEQRLLFWGGGRPASLTKPQQAVPFLSLPPPNPKGGLLAPDGLHLHRDWKIAPPLPPCKHSLTPSSMCLRAGVGWVRRWADAPAHVQSGGGMHECKGPPHLPQRIHRSALQKTLRNTALYDHPRSKFLAGILRTLV